MCVRRSAIMNVRLCSVCLCLLLLAAICPGTWCKQGGIFRGKGKSDGNKEIPSRSKGLSKQGLKAVGAAAGILGGMGTGYGLGFLGKGKHKTSHKTGSSDQHVYRQGQRAENRSQWNAAAPASNHSAILLSLIILLICMREP
uniref:Shadow of prion protein 2 n=1 Tax=Neogobius melanostomus TaxID=47308 RepID=A0A8C6SPV5_9GOBI